MNPARHIAVTSSGARIDLAAPDAALIAIADIADGLSQIARWNGATGPAPYYVAQHSVVVADDMYRFDGPRAAIYGLLHDAHEYLLGDVSRITEAHCGATPALEAARARLDRIIHFRFGLDWPPPASVRELLAAAHDRVVLTEMRDLFVRGWASEIAEFERAGVARLKTIIRARSSGLTRESFLARFESFCAGAAVRPFVKPEAATITPIRSARA